MVINSDEFKNLPEFYEITKIGEASYKQRYEIIEKLRNKEESQLTQDDLEFGVAFSLVPSAGHIFNPMQNSAKFWNYFYDNYEKYFSGKFSRVGLENKEVPDDVDQDDEDFDADEYPTFDDPSQQKYIIDVTLQEIPRSLLLDPDIREKYLKI